MLRGLLCHDIGVDAEIGELARGEELAALAPEVSRDSCLKMAELSGKPIEGAILKANSPSCGIGKIYDGTFSGKLVDGNGVFAGMLSSMGIEVITEKEKIKW